jgi:glutathione S-transferase
MDWQLTTLHAGMRTVYYALVRTPADERDMRAVTATAAELGKVWGRLDQALAGRGYIGGDHFTMGDIALGCWVHSWFALDLQRPHLPTSPHGTGNCRSGPPTLSTSWCC